MKNKLVIANWGHSNQGKSQTIRIIAEKIFQLKSCLQLSPDHKINFKNDISCIFQIDGKYKIGIECTGDPSSRIFDSLKFFEKENCDLIICNTRTSGATVKAVEKLKSKYEVIWVTNHRIDEKKSELLFGELNDFSAIQIIQLIEKYSGLKLFK